MRKRILPILAACAALFHATAAHAEDYDQQFSLSLDLLGQGAFVPGGTTTSDAGIGAAFFADWRPLPYLSLGTGLDFTQYLGNGTWQTGSWDLGGRLFPAGTQKEGEFYLQGTLGLSLVPPGTLMKKWPGHFLGSAGMGYRVFMGEGGALDLGFQFDLVSPLADPLTSVGLKVGWTWLFGKTPGPDKDKAVQPRSTPEEAAPPPPPPPVKKAGKRKGPARGTRKRKAAPTPTPDGTTRYTWVAGDNLEAIAEAFLGRGDLFPLIVDANRETLAAPGDLGAGVVIRIPQAPTDAQKDAARAKADSPEYAPWKKVGKPF